MPKQEQEYRIRWGIDLYATSPKAAAKKAQAIQRDVESTATYFDVSYHKTTKTKSGKVKSEYRTDVINLYPKG
jgi:hypothetical protein